MMKKPALFDDNSTDGEDENNLSTNKDYAKNYNKFRQKELLKKLKDRDYSDSSSTEDSSNDDSDSPANNPVFDQEFYKALALLKRKNEEIYDKNVNFFKDVEMDRKSTIGKKPKLVSVKDLERKVILEKGGVYEDEERPVSPTYVEEQNALKNEFKKILEDDEDDDDFVGGMLKKREKTTKEKEAEEANYKNWLLDQKSDEQNLGDNLKVLKPLKDYWSNPKLNKDEKFLRDYVLNNGYANQDEDQIPTYDEITGDNVSEDEQELERQAEFEHKFNFRFEEPDQEFIKRYPRTIENSVRRVDNRRKEKRQEVKERKLREKDEKRRELEMLKELKRKEIEEKINQLKSVSGHEVLPITDDNLEEDFDPAEHDKKMKEFFDDDYYGVDEGEEKPECPDIEDLQVEDWDNYDPSKDIGDCGDEYFEGADFNMDCDFDEKKTRREETQNELIEMSGSNRRKRKRRSKFAEVLHKEKPVFNPEDEKTYAEYIDEYYKMDCEDIIGDIPCRFKYVETVPNDFGLTVEEILMCKNKELNQWASLKKATRIRPEHVERNEIKLFAQKAKNEILKRKILCSLFQSSSDEEDDEKVADNKKITKRNIQPPSSTVISGTIENSNPKTEEKPSGESHIKNNEPEIKKKKNKKQKRKLEIENPADNQEKKPKSAKKFKINTDKSKITNNNQHKEQPNDKYLQENSITESMSKTVSGHIIKKNKLKKRKQINSNQNDKIVQKNKNKHDKVPNLSKFKKPRDNNKNSISDERLKAYGINPQKYHKKQKYGNKQLS